MRLYQHPMSANARAATMTALHLEAPVELVYVDLQRGEQTQPPFLKMNPNHRVPVLEDGEFYLWESRAIMQYLAEKTPGQSLYPTDLRARADVNRWLFWAGQHFTPAVGIFFFENVVKPMIGRGAPDPGGVETRRDPVQRVRGRSRWSPRRSAVGLRVIADTRRSVDRGFVRLRGAREGPRGMVCERAEVVRPSPGVGCLEADRADGSCGGRLSGAAQASRIRRRVVRPGRRPTSDGCRRRG